MEITISYRIIHDASSANSSELTGISQWIDTLLNRGNVGLICLLSKSLLFQLQFNCDHPYACVFVKYVQRFLLPLPKMSPTQERVSHGVFSHAAFRMLQVTWLPHDCKTYDKRVWGYCMMLVRVNMLACYLNNTPVKLHLVFRYDIDMHIGCTYNCIMWIRSNVFSFQPFST